MRKVLVHKERGLFRFLDLGELSTPLSKTILLPRIQKNEEKLRNLWDNFKRSNIGIIGVSGEEEEQEIKNLFEKIMK